MHPPPAKPVTFYECHPEDHAPAPSVRADFGGQKQFQQWLYHIICLTIGEIGSDQNHDLYISYHMYV